MCGDVGRWTYFWVAPERRGNVEAMRNEGITDRPVPPWQLPGAVRRDCEPHRGELLRRLDLVAVLLAWAGALLIVPSLLALALVAFIRFLARHDLALMRRGLLDPAGEADTRRAGRGLVPVALLPLLWWAGVALLVWISLRNVRD
jgi:hypothetical protein